MSFYVYETQIKASRGCFKCAEPMIDGFVMDNEVSITYYCSEKCLPPEYEEWEKEGMAYWTTWYDEVEATK